MKINNNRAALLLKLLLVISSFFLQQKLNAQNEWAYLKGYLNSEWPVNSYVAPGVPHPSNMPGSREHCGSGMFNNKIWIFGGEGWGNGHDIWYYDIALRSWVYMGGRGVNEKYTDLGVESDVAHPGDRSRMASAMDSEGNLWLFGGSNYDLGFHTGWNDLWKYNTHTDKWTWLGGSSTHTSSGSYKVPGVADWPRARYRVRAWFDEKGDYWIFGGVFYDGHSNPFPLNDMWKYNVVTKKWTCETGDCNTLHNANAPSGVYPEELGVPSVSIKPKARSDYAYWQDYDGHFWFYGGFNGETHRGGRALGDTWKYNPSSKEWTLLAIEVSSNNVSPGEQGEPLCWLGNDGLPWMRLLNRSVWKFGNGKWQNVQHDGSPTFSPPIIHNGWSYYFHSANRPGSHYTTFNHMKTDSVVFAFNGYGVMTDNTLSYTGSLWAYSLPQIDNPKIVLTHAEDDFDARGISPYSTSTRTIKIANEGSGEAKNVEVCIQSPVANSHSAILLSTIEIRDLNSNKLLNSIPIESKPIVINGLDNASSCNFNPKLHGGEVSIQIPQIEQGQAVTISMKVQHCMANFAESTGYVYSWNKWQTEGKYKNSVGRKMTIEPVSNEVSTSLESYEWTQYKKKVIPFRNLDQVQFFDFEVGSGTVSSPADNQDLGKGWENAQVKIELTLPPNVYLENGTLNDIEGEYAITSGHDFLYNVVQPSFIEWGYTKPDFTQIYIMKFPASRYLPIRRVNFKLRSKDGYVNTAGIKAKVFTTFNKNYATKTYGWKPSTY